MLIVLNGLPITSQCSQHACLVKMCHQSSAVLKFQMYKNNSMEGLPVATFVCQHFLFKKWTFH
jgi:hypothetical protein